MISLKHIFMYRRLAWYHCQWTKSIRMFSLSRINLAINHYETLGVTQISTQAEIKEAFLEKSKQLHPDKNSQNPKNHILFIAVNEAYSVLSKIKTRTLYDSELARKKFKYTIVTNCPRDKIIFEDSSLWKGAANDDKGGRNPNQGYYGIKGVDKVSNYYIAAGIVAFIVIGAIVHVLVGKIVFMRAVVEWERRDRIANQHLMQAEHEAKMNGNEKQLELFIQQMEKKNVVKGD